MSRLILKSLSHIKDCLLYPTGLHTQQRLQRLPGIRKRVLVWNNRRRFQAFCLKVMNYSVGGGGRMCSHLRIKPRIWCLPRWAIHHVHNKGVFAWRWKFMVALLCPNNSERCVRARQPLPKTAPLLSIKKHLHMFNFRLISKTFIGYWVIR